MNKYRSVRNARKRMLLTLVFSLMFLLAFSLVTAQASSITYNLHGITYPVSATVVMDYDGTNTLSIDVTNTSTSPASSSITAFAFNVPSEVVSISGFSYTGTAGWSFIPASYCPDTIDTDSINTPGNFGFFDIAGISSTNTSGGFNGGQVSIGITQNNTFSFDFTFCGTDLDTLNTASFFLPSAPKNQSSDTQPLIVRFQGIDLGGGEDYSDVALVPIPSAVLLFGSGILGLAGIRRKIKS